MFGIKTGILKIVRRLRRAADKSDATPSSEMSAKSLADQSADHWTESNVTYHRKYQSADESLRHFEWRSSLYVGYLDLMPVAGFDGKTVLDFGCGPGHDLVGFGAYSRPARLIGVDVSPTSLDEARARLALHGIDAELIRQGAEDVRIPLPDGSVDHVHSSGVLHHTPDPVVHLKELRRVLKPGGTMNLMIYNYDSVFVHLWVAYCRMIIEGAYPGDDLRSVFRRSTDGPDCPISNVYTPQEWVAVCKRAGLDVEFTGAAISLFEMEQLGKDRFRAAADERLSAESRKFLLDLTIDEKGMARYRGHYAGIDGCFALKP